LTLDPAEIDRLVRAALAEDVGTRDVTTEATVDAAARARGVFIGPRSRPCRGTLGPSLRRSAWPSISSSVCAAWPP
jgi:hypothetical protein